MVESLKAALYEKISNMLDGLSAEWLMLVTEINLHAAQATIKIM